MYDSFDDVLYCRNSQLLDLVWNDINQVHALCLRLKKAHEERLSELPGQQP